MSHRRLKTWPSRSRVSAFILCVEYRPSTCEGAAPILPVQSQRRMYRINRHCRVIRRSDEKLTLLWPFVELS